MNKTTITNCHKNIMGTLSFDGQFPGMRKAQDFIVYPMQDSGPRVQIQSDTRMGQLDLDTGRLVLSAPKENAGFAWLQICAIRKRLTVATLEPDDLQILRQWVKSSGGVEVGSSFVKCDNTGAMAL